VVVDENRLDLNGPEESMIFDVTIIDVECDEGFLRSDITAANMRPIVGKGIYVGYVQ
jgi:hypothetical protein